MVLGQTFPAGYQDSLRSSALLRHCSRRIDIGRSLRGQVFATKQRSDAGARVSGKRSCFAEYRFPIFLSQQAEKADSAGCPLSLLDQLNIERILFARFLKNSRTFAQNPSSLTISLSLSSIVLLRSSSWVDHWEKSMSNWRMRSIKSINN